MNLILVLRCRNTCERQGMQLIGSDNSVTPTTLIGRNDIAQTPGADRSNSLQMITDYVPGAYYTHDQLHIRGGHQVSWLIDGVPIPNTNIASNVGPQFDPKDIDYFEVQRGSYDADYGDRTYGVFNAVPRTGFERDKECDLVTSFGTMIWSPLQWSRPAWDLIFIIDFSFTALLLCPQILAWVYRKSEGLKNRREKPLAPDPSIRPKERLSPG